MYETLFTTEKTAAPQLEKLDGGSLRFMPEGDATIFVISDA